jgi:hypothetical protein
MAEHGRSFRLLVVAALAVSLSGCVGPTRTETALRKQASMSAESAVSELATIDVAVRTQLDGDAWWAYTDLVVTTSEEAVGTVSDTFTSRQPPSPDTDSVYHRVGSALSDAADLAGDVRIAVRRHDRRELADLRPKLEQLSRRLERLEQVG